MRTKTWVVSQKISALNPEVVAHWQRYCRKAHPAVQKLAEEKKSSRRKKLYGQIAAFDPELFSSLQKFLTSIFKLARAEGFQTVWDWMRKENADPLCWPKLCG